MRMPAMPPAAMPPSITFMLMLKTVASALPGLAVLACTVAPARMKGVY